MVQVCNKTFYPIDIESFSKEHAARALLEKGLDVSFNAYGFIVDAWDPRTKKLYNVKGEEVGLRNERFRYEDAPEYFEDHRNTFKEADKERFAKDSKEYELLDRGLEITLDKFGTLIEIRDPETNKLLDFELNEIGELEFLDLPDGYTKQIKNPLRVTYKRDDVGQFERGSDARNALEINDNMQITLDDKGYLIDIWDSVTGDLYDALGNKIGTRKDPYPSDNNIGNLHGEIEDINEEIRRLRAIRAALPKAARAAITAQIAALNAKRGHILWQWGRLMERKRRMDVAYQKRMIKSTTKQK